MTALSKNTARGPTLVPMKHSGAIRITQAGALGRADLEVGGTLVTVMTARAGVIASAALAVRSGPEEPLDLDLWAARAAGAVGVGVLVSATGDVATAGPPPAGGWSIRISERGPTEAATLHLCGGGLATVRSAQPAAAWRSVTVADKSWHQANEMAAAALRRAEGGPEWISSLGLAARLVGGDGRVICTDSWSPRQAAA